MTCRSITAYLVTSKHNMLLCGSLKHQLTYRCFLYLFVTHSITLCIMQSNHHFKCNQSVSCILWSCFKWFRCLFVITIIRYHPIWCTGVSRLMAQGFGIFVTPKDDVSEKTEIIIRCYKVFIYKMLYIWLMSLRNGNMNHHHFQEYESLSSANIDFQFDGAYSTTLALTLHDWDFYGWKLKFCFVAIKFLHFQVFESLWPLKMTL